MMLKTIFCYFALFKHLFFAINDADALTLLGGGDVIHKDAEVESACRQIGNVGALHGMADGLFHSEVFMGLDRSTNVPLFVGLLSLLVRSFFDRRTKGQKFGGLPYLLGFIFLDRSTKGQKFGGT